MPDDTNAPKPTPDAGKIEELPRKQVTDADAEAVKGGQTGVKKTMQTQV